MLLHLVRESNEVLSWKLHLQEGTLCSNTVIGTSRAEVGMATV